MKKTLLTLVAMLFVVASCNTPIEWNEETEAKFKKKCVEDNLAEKFKAGDADTFCNCFVQKMKEDEMGAMDMLKNMKTLVEGCGATFE